MFRINSRCISCGTCWQFDREHFANGGDAAVVCQQPQALPSLHRALLALQACPVAAIEASAEQRRQVPDHGFPVPVTRHRHGEVMYCGWASKRSFGACSWLIRRPDGNVMVDVPRWSAPLARRIKALGGLATIVLTHRDDVADHARWGRAFGAERWIHGADAAAAPEAERQVVGEAPQLIADGLRLIPTPGHTAGSMCLQLGEQRAMLFSGDHLWWSRELQVVVASERYCWWDFERQIQSVRTLLPLDVAWLLPGHGHRHAFAAGEWQKALEQTLAWVQR